VGNALFFRATAGFALNATLLLGTLNYGGVRSGGTWLIVGGVTLATLAWLTACFRERRWPASPPLFLLAVATLLAPVLGWSLGGFSALPLPAFTHEHLARVLARWPHATLAIDPLAAAALATALPLACWISLDLARHRFWAYGLAATLLATALIATGVALAQNWSGATAIFWQTEPPYPTRFWGPFYHHTSAGAFLNLVWPLTATLAGAHWLAARTFTSRFSSLVLAACAALLLAAHTTHVSRFPQVAAVLALLLLALALVRRAALSWRWLVIAPLLFTALACGIAAVAGRTSEIAERWRLVLPNTPAAHLPPPPAAAWPGLMRDDLIIANLYNAHPLGDRGEAWSTALRAIADRPLRGYGPSGWTAAAALHTRDPYVRTAFQYLQFTHQDFLQAAVQWGILGGLGFSLLLVGGMVVPWWGRAPYDSARLLRCGAGAGLLALGLQSLLDFPLQMPALALIAFVLAGLAWSGLTPSATPSA
jgi:O-Antigen ligase